jgi:hypothetical protein
MKLFKKVINILKCICGNHNWDYLRINWNTGKDIFECEHCGKRIEE